MGRPSGVRPVLAKGTGVELRASACPTVASAWRRGNGNLLAIVMNDGDQATKGQLSLDFARFGFKPGLVQCRDYGGVGLGYPNSMFSYDEKTHKQVDPQQLPVRDTVVESGSPVPVDIAQHSFKLFRFHQ